MANRASRSPVERTPAAIQSRTPASVSSLNAREVAERVAEFPFIVSFAYTLDETNWMADYLLPEATGLESLQLIRIGSTTFIEQFWNQQGWAVRQPVVDPVVDARDMTDIATELARRTGLLERYNQAINGGGDRVVGPATARVRAAPVVRVVSRNLDQLRARGGTRPGRVPVLGPHRPQHAVLVGRERRDSPHQRGRRERGRSPRGADQPRRRARARHRGRRTGGHRVGGRRDAGQSGAPRGGAAGHGGHDRTVRPLGDAVREGPRAREPQLGDAAGALPHRLHGQRGGPDAGAPASRCVRPGRRASGPTGS